MLQIKSSPIIGPKQILLQPLESYRNLEVDDPQCNDDFTLKIFSQTNNSLLETPIIKTNVHGHKKDGKKKVKFNLNIVHCQFNQREPALAIGRLVQKLINQKPHLQWVNPQILKN